jgi:hypothetical protein
MGESVEGVDENVLPFMHATPVFNFEQQHRYQDLLNVGAEIQSIAGHFTVYADLGQKMCAEFASLRKSFERMEVMAADASIRPLGRLFAAVDRAFSCHFNDVARKIVTDLNAFVKRELEELGVLEHEHQRLLKDYHSAEDEYTTLKAQSTQAKKTKTEHALTQAHTCSTLAFFEFCQKMERIELKIRSILPKTFLAYLTSVTGPFRDCLSAIDQEADLLNAAQTSVQEVDSAIIEFSQNSVQLKQQLSSQIPVFWHRLTAPFQKTMLTSIQGHLWKKTSGTLSRNWHKRFFMVSNGVLSWASTIDGAIRAQKHLRLVLCSVRPEPNAGRSHCFSLTQPNAPPMVLQALTQWDMEHWLAVIQNSIFMELNGEAIDRGNTVVTSAVCADCGSPNASWASINWAVSLCEACSADHRGLGSGVSKIRSLVLDDSDPLLRFLIDAIGTEKANPILESRLPPEEKIQPESAAEERQDFLAAKYRDRKWVAPADDVDIIHAVQEQALMDVYRCVAAGWRPDDGAFGALHAAAIVGNPLVLLLLCLNSTEIDVLDDAGWTPLCYAAYYDHTALVDILLAYGAQKEGGTVNPIDIARAKGNDATLSRFEGPVSWAPAAEMTPSEFELPHTEVSPAEFRLEEFVVDASPYRGRRPSNEVSPGDQRRLNSVVHAFRQKLSVKGGRSLILHSDDESGQS